MNSSERLNIAQSSNKTQDKITPSISEGEGVVILFEGQKPTRIIENLFDKFIEATF